MKVATVALRSLVLSAPLLVAVAGQAAAAGTAEKAAPPKCLRAEINPFTGRVVCINPVGAPVETPPEDAKLRCWPEARQGYGGPGCVREPGVD